MKALAIILMILTVALIAPGLTMLYVAVLGGHLSDGQIGGALGLFLGSIFSGLFALFAWAEVDR